jgi:hypothetical protein
MTLFLTARFFSCVREAGRAALERPGEFAQACTGSLDHLFLNRDTIEENSSGLCRIIGFLCLPVTQVVLQIIRGPSVHSIYSIIDYL